MRAIITVMGEDKVGIIAQVSQCLAKSSVNILDITQTTMQNIFTMIMLVDISGVSLTELRERLEKTGEEIGTQILLQHEDVFNSMHRI